MDLGQGLELQWMVGGRERRLGAIVRLALNELTNLLTMLLPTPRRSLICLSNTNSRRD